HLEAVTLDHGAHVAEAGVEHAFVRQVAVGDQPQAATWMQRRGRGGNEGTADVHALARALRMERRIGDDGVVAARQAAGDVVEEEFYRDARVPRREVLAR